MHTKFWLENLKGSDHLFVLCAEESMIIKSTLKERDRMMCTSYIRLADRNALVSQRIHVLNVSLHSPRDIQGHVSATGLMIFKRFSRI